MFVDDYLIDRLSGARRTLHRPVAREVSLERTKRWEGNSSGYTTVFEDGGLYRIYYRGTHIVYTQGKGENVHREVVCYAESSDGIHWTRPDLSIVEFDGSKKNNIIWDGIGSHNFTPFLDTNPNRTANAKYKAMGRGKSLNPNDKSRFGHGLYIFESEDAIHWKLTRDETVITEGAFDSQNLAFWDSLRGEYRAYVRDFREGRDIRTCTSKDFIHWSKPVFLIYAPGRMGQLYTNGVIPYYRAPHIFVGFPTRYADYGWAESTKQLPQREYREVVASASQRSGTAFTDSMFMSSRNALNFDVWPESFVRPGPQRPGSWFYGDKYQNWGIVETKSICRERRMNCRSISARQVARKTAIACAATPFASTASYRSMRRFPAASASRNRCASKATVSGSTSRHPLPGPSGSRSRKTTAAPSRGSRWMTATFSTVTNSTEPFPGRATVTSANSPADPSACASRSKTPISTPSGSPGNYPVEPGRQRARFKLRARINRRAGAPPTVG